jgi:Domain of unknown function (DUF4382)/Carboxypeptidase regulatory-like domain
MRGKTRRWLLQRAPAAVLLAGLMGCGGGGSSGPGTSGTGSVQVSLADAIEAGVTALDVTISRIDAHVVNVEDESDTNDAHWKTIVTGPVTVDLITLAKNAKLLGPPVRLPVGHYTQVRLIVARATITDATGTYDLRVPSGPHTGIKVHGGFDVQPNTVTEILLDFNVKGSLVTTGGGRHQLKPVPDIKAVVKVLSGTVSGIVRDAAGAPVDSATITATYTAGTNYPHGTVVNTTGSLADGIFKIWALLPGTYTIKATDAAGKTATRTGVVVSADHNTAIGTLTLH